ncbi:MAG: hypothetical protein CBB71_01240 [Rhodopirellula sp. TMED11]|nr:MAG: hypothetical protein CBB71_01240 [Rhodopirellula sp. TMED11]
MKPKLLLIDGYNLSQPGLRSGAASRRPDPRWLQRNREGLLRDLVDPLGDWLCQQTAVIFDAANPPKDRPQHYAHHGIDVRFSVGYASADDLLIELIREHHTPKRLTVVSSDHRIQRAAKARGARFYDSQPWLDRLLDGQIGLAVPIPREVAGQSRGSGNGSQQESGSDSASAGDRVLRGQKPRIDSPEEVDQWLDAFGFGPDSDNP